MINISSENTLTMINTTIKTSVHEIAVMVIINAHDEYGDQSLKILRDRNSQFENQTLSSYERQNIKV